MSVAHRFGSEGYAVALVSRSSTRHADHLKSLADAGVEAAAFVAAAAGAETALRDVVRRRPAIPLRFVGTTLHSGR
jgi:hypothetical protein